MDEQLVGRVTHYFSKIQVAVVEVTDSDLRVGDTIRVLGGTTNFTQEVASMEIDHAPVLSVQIGDLVGIEVSERARVNDLVYRAQHR
jgi:putative protease